MASKQGAAAGSLTADAVVRAAIVVLDEQGFGGVTTRAIAKELGVTMQTVLWHVGSKSQLLQLMADMIVSEVTYEALSDRWDVRVRELLARFRAALLEHRESANLFVGRPGIDSNIAEFSEVLIAALLEGLPRREAAWTFWTLYYFIIGLVHEEQAKSQSQRSFFANLSEGDHYPALRAMAAGLEDSTFLDRFQFGVELILE